MTEQEIFEKKNNLAHIYYDKNYYELCGSFKKAIDDAFAINYLDKKKILDK